jgi:hypothetical protein
VAHVVNGLAHGGKQVVEREVDGLREAVAARAGAPGHLQGSVISTM